MEKIVEMIVGFRRSGAVLIPEGSTGDLIRCKDCRWWDKIDESTYGYCHACKHGHKSEHWEIRIYRTYEGDWYCADGERKGDDQI